MYKSVYDQHLALDEFDEIARKPGACDVEHVRELARSMSDAPPKIHDAWERALVRACETGDKKMLPKLAHMLQRWQCAFPLDCKQEVTEWLKRNNLEIG